MSQQNVTAIRALYEAFNRGDFETMKRGFNTDFERFEPENSLYAEGNPYRGFEGSRDGVYAPRMRDFENWRTELQQIHDAGDFIITTGRYKARCKATGRDLSTQFCHILHLEAAARSTGCRATPTRSTKPRWPGASSASSILGWNSR